MTTILPSCIDMLKRRTSLVCGFIQMISCSWNWRNKKWVFTLFILNSLILLMLFLNHTLLNLILTGILIGTLERLVQVLYKMGAWFLGSLLSK